MNTAREFRNPTSERMKEPEAPTCTAPDPSVRFRHHERVWAGLPQSELGNLEQGAVAILVVDVNLVEPAPGGAGQSGG